MKKKIYIAISAFLVVVLVVVVGITVLLLGGAPILQEKKPVTIYDNTGQILLQSADMLDMYDAQNWQYLELVWEESLQSIALEKNCTLLDAENYLYSADCKIYTAFDEVAFEALQEAQEYSHGGNFACAITDLKGNLVAVYSADKNGKQINYLKERMSPYSSFKALSVYTPAVEKGIANWSKLYHDSPYKKVKDEAGIPKDWPANVTNTYSQANITAYEALRKSVNTVAVKCLAEVGVAESIDFLQTSFNIPLKQEEFVLNEYGAEEVIGSIALGYLEVGITPVEMAGYYQIFANGGLYTSPKTVTKITAEGVDVYIREDTPKQVIRPDTADLMNKLLQGVVEKGGTGEMANCYNVDVAGKTGTGDDYKDNWFVGVTPGYSLAVWHGQNDKNHASEMFAGVIEELYEKLPNANKTFITHKNLSQLAYCIHSGKAFSEKCTTIETGYFTNIAALGKCDLCGNDQNKGENQNG